MPAPFFSPASIWIASPLVGGVQTSIPVPYLRKSFNLPSAATSTRLKITALGVYECEVNGSPVTKNVFCPGWTDYHSRVAVQEYDVTALLRPGANVLGVILGDGWYCGRMAWNGRQTYGDRPKLRAELLVSFADGTEAVIATDASWKTTVGPILESDMQSGEAYDARRELPGWSAPGFDDASWWEVVTPSVSDPEFVADSDCPVRRIEEIAPLATIGKGVIDFGQNFTGRARLKVQAQPGRTLSLRFAEILDAQGNLYTENLRSARATDYYTCKSAEPEIWEPRFTFHGFRYASIAGLKEGDTAELTGVVLHSDMRPTGSFACSEALLNQLQHNIVWGQKSNFLEVPTDCPQRDERLGWTGDAQVFVRTAAFNMDVRQFFHKWMRDLRDAQGPDGAVPAVIPDVLSDPPGKDGGPAWADAALICPWTIYLCYGDRQILEDHYASMTRFMDFLAAHRTRDFIRSHPLIDSWGGFGDWLALDGSGKTEGGTPRDLIGTAFYAYGAEIMTKVAKVLNRDDEARTYALLHEKIVAAFRQRFVTGEGLIASGTQTSYVLALHFGLIPEEQRPAAARELVRDIEKRAFHLATGFVGTPYLLDVLEDRGHLDVAYKLLEQESFPSWLFPVKNGATTIWERWDGWTPDKGFQSKGMNSFNHYAYGAVGAWMYRTVAGLDLDPQEPGYKHIIFRPRPGGSLTSAQASLETAYGRAAIAWERKDGWLQVTLTVPENTHATFEGPPEFGGTRAEFQAGTHEIHLSAT